VPLSDYALDRFVSQEMSKLTECKVQQVASSFPDNKNWVSNFVLNSIFRFQIAPETKRFAFLFLRRAESAFVEYEHVQAAMYDYVRIAQTQAKKPSLYFRTLHHLEMTIAMLWQAYSFTRSFTGKDLYEQGQNSPYERLNNIYNDSRYFNHTLSSDHLHSVWITNEGIHTERCSISFEELEGLLEEVGRFADAVSSGSEILKEE
jgi:hypothetical protein